jgi:hypothetical protein
MATIFGGLPTRTVTCPFRISREKEVGSPSRKNGFPLGRLIA